LIDFRTFLELSAQLFCIVDCEGFVCWCNAAFEQTLSYEQGELVGGRLFDLMHPDDAAVGVVLGDSYDAPGDAGFCEIRLRAKGGEWRWLEWTTRVDRARRRVYGAARDVTGRREHEAVLRASEARLSAIMSHSPSVIFVKDLEGRFEMVNEEFVRVTGLRAEDVIGRMDTECLSRTAANTMRRDRQVIDSSTSLVNQEKWDTAIGPREFVVSRFLFRDESGTPYALGAIASDVTERLRTKKALAERDILLDSVIKASPDTITLMDRTGKIHQISETDSAMFGYRHDVFSRTAMFDFVHPDDFDDVASLFIRMVTGAESHLHLRYRVRHADGHWVTVDSRSQAILDAQGHFAGAVVVSRDITAKLESEQKLQSSREAAEHASKAKSEFLSRMSHELRTPLNSILGFAQLLQMDELTSQQADAVEHILRAGRHLLDLIDEVLDIARIESGHMELTLAPVVVAEIAGEAIDLTKPLAARAEVTIRSAFDSRDKHVVIADRQRLMQVLLNLLSNAVKYNRPGGWVDVTSEKVAPGQVRVSVADSGRGIPPQDLDRVFVPFDRLGAEQTGVEGTGVGLALSQHLCTRMGGTLGVDSVADVGSTFFIELPAIDEATTADGSSVAEAPVGESAVLGASPAASRVGTVALDQHASVEGRAVGHELNADDSMEMLEEGPGAADQKATDSFGVRHLASFRVLLVEDNLTTLDLVERVLSRRPGTEVLAAMQGRLGVDLAREHLPDLILLDLQLPDMSGSAVLDRLAEEPSTAAIPVAVVGAEAPAQQVRQLLGRGVIGFLAKPIDVRGLLSLVDAVRAARGK
jgi:PAS domain S-box-containing protein